jgi:hypothetical protein
VDETIDEVRVLESQSPLNDCTYQLGTMSLWGDTSHPNPDTRNVPYGKGQAVLCSWQTAWRAGAAAMGEMVLLTWLMSNNL